MIGSVGTKNKAAKSSPSPLLKKKNVWAEGRYLSIASVVLYLLFWVLITEDGLGLVKPIKFPSPSMVAAAAVNTSSVIATDVLATSLRVLSGLFTGVLLGVGLGLLMCFSKKVFYFFDPIIESARPVPVIAMIPFFLMWFGINETGKFLLVVMGVFSIMVVNTIESVRNVPPIYTRAAETLGANRGTIYRRIIIPAIVPALIGPLRVAAAMSFTLVVAAEFMGAQAGMGYRILEARRMFNTDVIFLGVVMFGILSSIFDIVIRRTTGYMTRWSERTQ